MSDFKRTAYRSPLAFGAAAEISPVMVVLGAAQQDSFSISAKTLNEIEVDDNGTFLEFPGNVSPEGYFYQPFHEVTLKELDDVIQQVNTKRINFAPSQAEVYSSTVTFYNPEMGIFEDKEMRVIEIVSPVPYNYLAGQPFCIYDILKDETFRGHLDTMYSGYGGQTILKITVPVRYICKECGYSSDTPFVECPQCGSYENEELINERDLRNGYSGKSRYIIASLDENAPEYAEYIPRTEKLIWRAPKKMSDLTNDSPIYNMPFANGRLYVHKNVNVFLKRQDPDNRFRLFRPAVKNPLRRFQVEGNPPLDFDYIQTITDSMVDAC